MRYERSQGEGITGGRERARRKIGREEGKEEKAGGGK